MLRTDPFLNRRYFDLKRDHQHGACQHRDLLREDSVSKRDRTDLSWDQGGAAAPPYQQQGRAELLLGPNF
jgi:hypothetical protein